MRKLSLTIISLFLVANAAVWYQIYAENQRGGARNAGENGGSAVPGQLTVAFLDIGQGDAIYIEAPNGNQVVVDGGPNAKILHELGRVMPWYDKTLDMIVITNPDKDHIAGFVDVLKRYKVSYLLESGTENKSLVNNEVERLAAEKGVEKLLARRGMQIVLDPGRGTGPAGGAVVLTILFPDRDVSKEKPNDGSIVMRLTYGDTEVMLTGDAPSGVEKHLVALVPAAAPASAADQGGVDLSLESDVLKVGHHGSRTSTSQGFVQAVNPQFAVISSGRDNKYGHPHPETLDTLGKFPIKILRTDQLGTIVTKSDGRRFVVEE